MYSVLPVCVKPAAPPAAASPLGWHSDNPRRTVEDASLDQNGCTTLSKTLTKQKIYNSETNMALLHLFLSPFMWIYNKASTYL